METVWYLECSDQEDNPVSFLLSKNNSKRKMTYQIIKVLWIYFSDYRPYNDCVQGHTPPSDFRVSYPAKKSRLPQIERGGNNNDTMDDNTACISFNRKYRVFNLKVDRILIWVIYLLRFTTYYVTQLTCIYSKCWKWCPFISMHLSTRFTMFLATFLSVLLFISSMARVIFIFNCFRSRVCLLNFSKKLCLQWA
jgi:hypothetical protein